MFSSEDDLTSTERAAFAALPRETPPGDMLEERIVRALRNEGHFGASLSKASRRIALGWRIAAALMLFAGGVATGRYLLAPASPRAATLSPVDRAGNGAGASPSQQAPATSVRSNEKVVAVEMWL